MCSLLGRKPGFQDTGAAFGTERAGVQVWRPVVSIEAVQFRAG